MSADRPIKLLILLHHRFELWRAPDWLPERIRREFPQLEVVHRTTYEDIQDYIPDAEIYFGWSLRGDQFRSAKKLRWIHSTAAGVHLLMSPELRASDVLVTNARSVHGPVVAEHALALMFALAKRLPSAARHQRQHLWAQEQLWNELPHPRELSGSTLGLIGFGSIGQNLADRARGLGMRVLAVREHGGVTSTDQHGHTAPGSLVNTDGTFEIHGPARLEDVISRSDFLVLAAPLTERTRHLINAARLACMKSGAYLVNISRGPLVDEAALLDALRQRRIGGAALDVFSEEPLPSNSPLWDLDNLLITPHTAAVTEKLWERHYALIAENLRRYLSGQPLLGLVNKQSGY